jgi:hypothetical protein
MSKTAQFSEKVFEHKTCVLIISKTLIINQIRPAVAELLHVERKTDGES